jgi:hypothetical protein
VVRICAWLDGSRWPSDGSRAVKWRRQLAAWVERPHGSALTAADQPRQQSLEEALTELNLLNEGRRLFRLLGPSRGLRRRASRRLPKSWDWRLLNRLRLQAGRKEPLRYISPTGGRVEMLETLATRM